LAHARIDDRDAGAATLPSLQMHVVARPRESLEASVERLRHRARKVIDQMMRELSPQQLGCKGRIAQLRAFAAQRVPHLTPRELAEMQMRRQRRGALAIRSVSGLRV